MKFVKNKKGFTLVEMVVVIAIIGILAAAVLTALGPSRNKAKDARIISGVTQVRALAEVVYDPGNAHQYAGVVDTNPNFKEIDDDLKKQNSDLIIQLSSPSTNYAAYAKLSDGTSFYCVDSTGFSGTIAGGTIPTTGFCI